MTFNKSAVINNVHLSQAKKLRTSEEV